MKRTIFAIFALMALSLFALAPLEAAHAAAYPTAGTCTGDNVRLRSSPNSEGTKNIVGRLNKGDAVLVFGEVFANGDMWYQAARPDGKGKAWISARYLELRDAGPAAAYPTEGTSTGDGVRLRSAPSAKGTKNVVGALNKEDTVLVFGEVFEEDNTWYEVARPDGKGRAWVNGRFLELLKGLEPVDRILLLIRHDFPKTPRAARARFGAPSRQESEERDGFNVTTLTWPRFECSWLDENFLQSVEMRGPSAPGVQGGKDLSFGGVRLGDPESKVIDILGEPESRADAELSYNNEGEYQSYINFGLKDGRVVTMHYFYEFN